MKWIGSLFKNPGGWEAFVALEEGAWFLDKHSPIEIGIGKSGVMLIPRLQALGELILDDPNQAFDLNKKSLAWRGKFVAQRNYS